MNRATLPADAAQLVDIQAKLTDEQKTIAYYWVDGPGSELPPRALGDDRPGRLPSRRAQP
jgi:hypothetical protein